MRTTDPTNPTDPEGIYRLECSYQFNKSTVHHPHLKDVLTSGISSLWLHVFVGDWPWNQDWLPTITHIHRHIHRYTDTFTHTQIHTQIPHIHTYTKTFTNGVRQRSIDPWPTLTNVHTLMHKDTQHLRSISQPSSLTHSCCRPSRCIHYIHTYTRTRKHSTYAPSASPAVSNPAAAGPLDAPTTNTYTCTHEHANTASTHHQPAQ